jgi:RNA polymerase sigma-70 factor (ECF subfamily)
MSDQASILVEAACRGDETSAAQLIELYYERIYAFLRRLTANDSDAADLTQRTFSSVWQALPTFAGRSSVSSWIHGIAYHVYVDWRRVNRPTEPRSNEWWGGCPSADAGPDEIVARQDMRARVYAVVDELDRDLRETVHLHYYQSLTLEETAAALGIAVSTVKYRLRSALAELQRRLAADRMTLGSLATPKAV